MPNSTSPFAVVIALLAALPASGCVVSQAKYDEAVLRADAEGKRAVGLEQQLAELRQRADETGRQLDALNQQWQASEARLAETKAAVDNRERTLAELEHEREQQAQQHEEKSAMVEQLRDELGRVATHISGLAEQRDQMAAERETLSKQVEELSNKLDRLDLKTQETRRRALIVKDLTLALHEPLAQELMRLDVRDERVLVWTRSSTLFVKDTDKLTVEGKRHLTAMAKSLSRSTEVVEVEERGAEAAPKLRSKRLHAISELFVASGVELTRLALKPPPPASKAEGADRPSADASGKSPQIIFAVFAPQEQEHALAPLAQQ